MEVVNRKQNGIHYTPPRLAQFLAEQIVNWIDPHRTNLAVLDPACGNGRLLTSWLTALPFPSDGVSVAGFDTNAAAIENARRALADFRLKRTTLRHADFLERNFDSSPANYDCVIANPPYVRTQVLGGKRAQRLSQEFGLTGRVDLYQAFVAGITRVLRPGGVLGLLTSNRFLTVKAGAAMRRLLDEQFIVKAIFDLGDSKLFDAAVLPLVLIAVKRPCDAEGECEFHRVYAAQPNEQAFACDDLLDELAAATAGPICSRAGYFEIERGHLVTCANHGAWSLSNARTASWLGKVRRHQACTFAEVAEIKVGIKTTADNAFIKEEWSTVEPACRPEADCLRPLLTHHVADRWRVKQPIQRQVLYPYDFQQPRRTVVSRTDCPKTFAYLEKHRAQLESRKYVIESGRKWFEIWVPHQPVDWALPKIVWPDISKQPRFFLDTSGAIVNGDCYWIKLRPGSDPDWLYLMLAVANSTVATRFYDIVFHNKLYAGRRRFMTQYVREFPLPDLFRKTSKQIVSVVKNLVAGPSKRFETHCERLVQQAFGFQ